MLPGRDWSKCKLVSRANLHTHCWFDSCVVYDPDSGDTHAMNKNQLYLLELLREKPISFGELQSMALAAGPKEVDGLHQLLAAWENLGLLEVVSGSDAH